MRRSRFSRFILFLLFFSVIILSLSYIIMTLWNNIMVAILHVSVINFWQALGLFALSKILFGGFHGRPGWAGHGRRRREMEEMRNKWFNLSPEERKHFKQNLKNRCGGMQAAPAPESAGTE